MSSSSIAADCDNAKHGGCFDAFGLRVLPIDQSVGLGVRVISVPLGVDTVDVYHGDPIGCFAGSTGVTSSLRASSITSSESMTPSSSSSTLGKRDVKPGTTPSVGCFSAASAVRTSHLSGPKRSPEFELASSIFILPRGVP